MPGSMDPPSAPIRMSLTGTTDAAIPPDTERRSYRRHGLRYPIELEAELRGFSFALSRFAVSAVTVNISRGGMLVRADQAVPPQARCLVRFVGTAGRVEPEILWGEVRWSRLEEGDFLLGIRFETPLQTLRIQDLSS